MQDDDILPSEGESLPQDSGTSGSTSSDDTQTPAPTSKEAAEEFQKKIEENQEAEITPEVQEKLNEPLKKTVKPEYKEYLKMILDLIEKKEIEVFTPSTFINEDIYNALDEKAKAAVDMTLVNIAQMVQQLQYLKEKEQEESFQTESLVDNIWYTKERIESKYGDVYKV